MVYPFKMVSWNIRGGLSNLRKQRFLRFLGRSHGFSFLRLLETKKEIVDDFLVRRLWVNADYGYSFIPSTGRSAGLV